MQTYVCEFSEEQISKQNFEWLVQIRYRADLHNVVNSLDPNCCIKAILQKFYIYFPMIDIAAFLRKVRLEEMANF